MGNGNYNLATLQIQRNGGANPLRAASGETVSGGSKNPLTAADLDQVVEEAIARWNGALDSAAAVELLQDVRYEITDLPDDLLGSTNSNIVALDLGAAGYGWFIDATPTDDAEFDTFVANTEYAASAGSEAFGAMDLLTVVMHELGHVLGRSSNWRPPWIPTATASFRRSTRCWSSTI